MSNHGKRRLHFGFNYGFGGNFLRHRLPGTSPDSKVNFLTPLRVVHVNNFLPRAASLSKAG
jgi:hypothetical protein